MKVEQKIAAAFLVALLAVALVGAATYFNARNLLDRNALVVHTYRVLGQIDDFLNSLNQAQSGVRGYLLTGQPADLQLYHAGIGAIGSQTAELRRLTADNPLQQRSLDRLQGALNLTIAGLTREVAARQLQPEGAPPARPDAQDKANMDQVRFLCAGMRGEENHLLDQRSRQSSQSASQTLVNFGLLLALAAISLLAFFFFIRSDLLERRRVEMALEESDKRFRGVMESAPDAMLLADSAGKIQLVNAQAEQLFGYSREEFADGDLRTLLIEREQSMARTEPGKDEEGALDQDQAFTAFQSFASRLAGVRKDGTIFPVDLSRSLVEVGGENLVISSVRDRSDRERAEEALRKFSLELARSNAELERFAYVASHDLQEPLRMVSSYTQLLAKRYKGKLGADADEFISYAVDGASRMQKLINDLLALSRIGTQAKPSEPVPSREVLVRVLADMQLTIEGAGATVIYPETMPTVLADRTQIGQLFQNLVGNAVKFRGPDAPRVEITTQPPEEANLWRFAFKDNGIGIAPQYFERIFVIFQRLHNKESYPGTGIGLAICQKIVERHGGRLWVESAPGEGTTFFFTLPAAT